MTVRKLDSGLYEADVQGVDKVHTVTFEKWGAESATDTLLEIVQVGGEAAGSLLSVIMGGGLDQDATSSPVEALFRQLSMGMTRDKKLTKDLLKKLCSNGGKVLVDGVTARWPDFYNDKLPLSFAVAKANLEVQYGNFFDAAKSMGLLAATPEPKDPPPA